MRQRIVVGISGGVDSSVAAYRLIREGYEVVGAFMKNWDDNTGLLKGDCPFEDDLNFARLVCRRLSIPLEVVDLTADYKERVIEHFFAEYAKGRTPNPDVLCNREIKFQAFWEAARGMGAEYVATGHYCRKDVMPSPNGEGYRYRLLAGVDASKDQSYFLCQVTQEQLSHALFPIGSMLKSEVRSMASELGLATAGRRDSYGICFVGEIDLPTFLSQRIAPQVGSIVEIPRSVHLPPVGQSLMEQSKAYPMGISMGEVVGQHGGAHYYTIGQRRGLGVGGKALPLFVLGIDILTNTLYVGQGHDHPLLSRRVLRLEPDETRWINPEHPLRSEAGMRVMARLRHRQQLQAATLHCEGAYTYLRFDQPQRGVTPGQYAAWYMGEELLGSGPVAE